MSKKNIRANILTKMKQHNSMQKNEADNWLATELINSQAYQNASSIGFVLSLSHEVNTYQMIQQALNDNKELYVPEVNYQTKVMTFKQLLNINDIEKDEKGINHSVSESNTSNHLDLIVVPGVGFRKDGYRIGYGGGYYDRFLSNFKTNTISLLYDFQLTDFQPDTHDQPVDQLIIYNSHQWRHT
ncbi:5-formyltetrahydrofolate cyclo-ligase [Staphylococcus pasteuri]|uniref:5-formyltetrahydrofolate cyclo-ligase n=1 Tax=Staphylococcus TaxID=1279 RepID=UPI00086D3DD1|nr:5-formyltetrahydrofolate cyclo-ligase [Staphylococcus pasteuri]MCO0860750.1 5-formyltetrahydrofolate cyclo-ligase [Staphylococcus pasteuri]MCO5359516.1 5-formyltetrahydrofolate cyclo-ligase [Staphylococcus pasteuri]ODB40305.1 5-formyltetrahydrofolate cyclo-ligase [Staphylococcus sp. AOAB]